MAFWLFGAKPLSESISRWLNATKEQNSVKFNKTSIIFIQENELKMSS